MPKSRMGRRPRSNREDLARIRFDQRRQFKASAATRALVGSSMSEEAMLQRYEDACGRVHGTDRGGPKVCRSTGNGSYASGAD